MNNNDIKSLTPRSNQWYFVIVTSMYSLLYCYIVIKMFAITTISEIFFIGSISIYILLTKLNNMKLSKVFGICLLITIPLTLKSLTSSYNELATYIGLTKGYYLPQFMTTTSTIEASILLACLVAFTLFKTVEKRLIYPYVCAFITVLAWQVYSEQAMSFLLNSSLLILLLGVIITAKFTYQKKVIRESIGIISVSILLLVSSLFMPPQQSNLHLKTTQAIQNSLYNRQSIDWKTDGDMMQISKAATTDKEALTLIMEQPTAMYLKGFIGSKYKDNQWTTLSNQTYYYAQPLLETLKKNDFTSETMLGNTYRQMSKEEPTMVRVFPKYASKKYSYSPYELITAITSTSFQRDGLQNATTWSKASHYEYKIMNKARIMYPVTAQQEKTATFLATEAHYNEFVYKNYLQLTIEDREIIDSHYEQKVKSVQSYDEAIKIVQQYLQNNLRFDENTKAITEEESFVATTLQQTKRGFSPHYATIATLIFRDLNIPARYVEGYIVTKEAVENKKAYSEIFVSGRAAHAWTEIYLDQLGWIPVEVTPGFEKKMPKLETPLPAIQATQARTHSSAQKTQTAGEQDGKKEVIEDTDITVEPQPKKEKERWPIWLKWLVITTALIVALLLVVCIYVHSKRKYVRSLKNTKKHLTNVQQVQAKLAYIEWQLVQILQLKKPTQSLYSWLDVLPKNYTRAMEKLIIEYQKITYGQLNNTEDFERYIEQIQNSINKPLSKWQQVKYYCQGLK